MDDIMENVMHIYTDGSCRGNPGPGGYGVAVYDEDDLFYIRSEQSEETTNNREELKAIIEAVKYANSKLGYLAGKFIIYSDSSYCVNICNNWMYSWAQNNWINSKKEVIKNKDLVEILYNYFTTDFLNCRVEVKKIKGHAGHEGNELADALATNDKTKIESITKLHRDFK